MLVVHVHGHVAGMMAQPRSSARFDGVVAAEDGW